VPEILEKKTLAPQIHQFKFQVPRLVQKAKPGQFVILRANEFAERIPMSIAGLDKEKGILTIVVLEVGKSTAFLGTLETGDFILDLFGPLGQPTEMGKHGTVVCVGGGIGIAPLYPLIQGYKTDGNRVITIIGARSKNLLIKENELGAISDEIICTTDDGSYGMKGLVTDALAKVIQREKVGLVMAVGPVVMMKAISDLTKKNGIKTIVSLNPIMVDGTGMCGGCRVVIDGKNKFACVDGPDFDAHLVDFDNLTMRQKAYQAEERLSYEAYQCKALNSVKVV
jgi:ferredoxin--NADP+ reductase